METLFLARDAVLERGDGTLVVRVAGGPRRHFPVHSLRHVVVAGEARLTTAVLALISKSDIRLTILDHFGNVSGAFEPLGSPASGTVRLAQARHALDPVLRLAIAKRIVRGTMRNLRANLSYRTYRGTIALRPAITAIVELERKTDDVESIQALMGLEGSARSWYFEAWPLIDPRLSFGKRVRRPPNNPINCLLSWFNGLCYAAMRHAIAQTHLDGCISFLHAPTEARHSLALDLAEAFKPVLTDTLIFEVVLRDRMDHTWFLQENGACRLSETGRLRTLEMWSSKVETEDNHERSMRQIMRKEALGIERHILGLGEYKPFLRVV